MTAPGELVDPRLDRILTQYRESPGLLFLLRNYLSKIEEAAISVENLPSFFDIDSAVGDQLTLVGKRLGWPRCHCVCQVTPVFGFACAGFSEVAPTVVKHGNDGFTKILLHMDGADGDTTFTDTNFGGSSHTWTAVGNAQIDTTDSKFGGASGQFDGTGDWITTPDHADYTLGSNPFTIDTWFNIAGGDGASIHLAGHCDAGITAAASSFFIQRTAANKLAFFLSNGAGFVSLTTAASYSSVSNPGRHHLEICRSGNLLYMFIDGVLSVGPTAFASAVPNSAGTFFVANAQVGTAGWNGWIDEFRLSVGIARHTASFSVPTAPYDLDAIVSPDPARPSMYPIVGFCESGTWAACDAFGVSEICIDDDEIYRGFLRARRYQMLSLYDIENLTYALQSIWGSTAMVLDAGNRRVVIAPGRELSQIEDAIIQLVPRVLPIAPGIVTRVHFGTNLHVFGFGAGWGGFCEPLYPDGVAFDVGAGVLVTETGAWIITGPLTTGAPWMCEIDVKPYTC